MPNYDVVKSADKKRLMDLGLDQGTAHILARGRKFWVPYGDRKSIIETDWEELYDIFMDGAFPMGIQLDKSIKESHKRGFMEALAIGQKKLLSMAVDLEWGHLMLNQINNWNTSTISYEFLNWQDNPLEVKE